MPSKMEEDHCRKTNKAYQVTKILVEIRDVYSPPLADPTNPWLIRKKLTAPEAMTGKILVSHREAFDHVFRHWTLDMTTFAVMGSKLPVAVWDFTEDNNPVRFCSDKIFFERGPSENYIMGMMDLVQSRGISPLDEIGIYWDVRSSAFHFKLLSRNSNQANS
uniref:Uncharacterized protein n=1 Tax=Kalanchoe fedtschenkoi TaxID=63787 RepID=A0A7N0TI86_KALFE